jgi:hypothetical protein
VITILRLRISYLLEIYVWFETDRNANIRKIQDVMFITSRSNYVFQFFAVTFQPRSRFAFSVAAAHSMDIRTNVTQAQKMNPLH